MIRFELASLMERLNLQRPVDLQAKTGLRPSTIHGLLKRNVKRIDLEVLEKLCVALNVSVDQLLQRDSLIESIQRNCRTIRIVVGTRVRNVNARGSRKRLPRPQIDYWDVRALGEMMGAIAAARPMLGDASIEVVVVTKNSPAPPALGDPSVLTISLGSPISNSATLPLLKQVAKDSQSVVRFRMDLRAEDVDIESMKLRPLLFDEFFEYGSKTRRKPPTGIGILGSFRSEDFVTASSHDQMKKSGTYSDAAAVFVCREKLLILCLGCGGPGTYAAARKIREDGLASFSNDLGTTGQVGAAVYRVELRKPTDDYIDDREVTKVELVKVVRDALAAQGTPGKP